MQPFLKTCVLGLRKRVDSLPFFFVPVSTVSQKRVQQHARRLEEEMERVTRSQSRQGATPRPDKFLFVGLGNHDLPRTRHSVGMQAVDRMADCFCMTFKREKSCAGSVAHTTRDGIQIIMLKPKMPMNVNGTSVAKTARCYNVSPQNIYLLHDDIDRHTGYHSMKEKGSANGHNGVKSVINSLCTDVMPRVKIGIDRPASKSEVADYVLQNFSHKEQRLINRSIDHSLRKIAEHLERKIGSNDLGQVLQRETSAD